MALPTTGLTFHINASVDTDLWTVNTAGTFSVHPTDGQEADYADDVEHNASRCATKNSTGPVWRSGTPLMLLPCLDFNGSSEAYKTTTDLGVSQVLNQLITNSAFTILASVYVEGITSNAAAAYDNDSLLGDAGTFMGIEFKNNADPHVLFYNWDGNEDTISLAISLNTSYVLMFRHEGGNIYASINGGSETSIASGNTSDITAQLFIGTSGGTPRWFNGRMGELAIWNAALTGSDLTDAVSYFTAKWLPAAGGGGKPHHYYQQMRSR